MMDNNWAKGDNRARHVAATHHHHRKDHDDNSGKVLGTMCSLPGIGTRSSSASRMKAVMPRYFGWQVAVMGTPNHKKGTSRQHAIFQSKDIQ